MIVPNKKDIDIVLSSLEDDVSIILKNECKFLFIENNVLYFSILSEEANKEFLRKNWSKVKTRFITGFNIKKIVIIKQEDINVLFLEKAIELFNAKEVKISLA